MSLDAESRPSPSGKEQLCARVWRPPLRPRVDQTGGTHKLSSGVMKEEGIFVLMLFSISVEYSSQISFNDIDVCFGETFFKCRHGHMILRNLVTKWQH